MLLDTLDQYEVQFVTYFMSRFPQIILRATCPFGESIFVPEKISLSVMLRDAAKNEHRDLCELAYEWALHTMSKTQKAEFANDLSMMFSVSAACGHLDMCILAKKLINEFHYKFVASAFSENFRYAAAGADPIRARDICIFIHEWIMEMSSDDNQNSRDAPAMHLRGMIDSAMTKGNCELCILALKWGRESPESDTMRINEILNRAAQLGRYNICEAVRVFALNGPEHPRSD